jgi:hypothetical protein
VVTDSRWGRRPIKKPDPDNLLTRPEKRRASKEEARREALFSDIKASLRKRTPMKPIKHGNES